MARGVLVVTLLLVPLLSMPSGAAQPSRTDEVLIHTADGIDLAATLWIPAASGPRPAVLLAHGFGADRSQMVEAAERYAALGFVALAWDARGFGESGGRIEVDGPREVEDVRTLVTWLANRPEVLLDAPADPRVGMRGLSYGGAVQLLAAAADARLDALVPLITWSDLDASLYPNEVLKVGWVTFFYAAGNAAGHGATGANPNAGGFDPVIHQYFAEALLTNDLGPEARAYLGERSPARLLERVRAPALLVQGWPDTLFPGNEAARTYTGLVANGTPAKLVYFDGGHGHEDTLPAEEAEAVEARIDAWLLYWLDGRGTADTLFSDPVEWWDGARRGFVPEESWPVADETRLLLHLVAAGPAEGRLEAEASAGETRAVLGAGGITSYSDLPIVQQFLGAPGAQAPLTSYAYRSAPFVEPVLLLGAPRLHLAASTTAPDATLFVKVYDEAPDGSAVLLDTQVTPYRLRGPDAALEAPRDFEFDLTPLHRTFEAGHRLRLVLATSDGAYGSGRVPGVVGIRHEAAHPGWLSVPTVPRRTNDTEAPTIGAPRVEENRILVRIEDDQRVAKALLAFEVDGRERVLVGLREANGTFAFTFPFHEATHLWFYVMASDAAGHEARTWPVPAEVGPASEVPRPVPGVPATVLLLLVGLLSLVVGRRPPPIRL